MLIKDYTSGDYAETKFLEGTYTAKGMWGFLPAAGGAHPGPMVDIRFRFPGGTYVELREALGTMYTAQMAVLGHSPRDTYGVEYIARQSDGTLAILLGT